MSIDITSIENSRLRQAAQAADSHDGTNGYNKKLDNSEFNVFIKQASKLGVSSEEIMGIVPMDSVDEQTKKTVGELQSLEKARRDLENAQEELNNRKSHYEVMLDDIDEAGPHRSTETGEYVGMAGGAIAGLATFVKISKYASTATRFFSTAAGGFGGALIGTALGFVINKGINALLDHFNPTYNQKVLSKEADQYKESNLKPLEERVDALKREVADKEGAFFK